MNKSQVDKFFTDNFQEVQRIIDDNCHKSVTKNVENITTDLYLLAVDKAPQFNNKKELKGFIIASCANIYRWSRSKYNIENRSLANDAQVPDKVDGIDEDELIHQRRLYALRKYYYNASPSQKRFYDIYINDNIRAIRKVKEYLGISFRASIILIEDFKQKCKEYEREIEIEGK